jgi:hypothetical protein
MIVTITITVNEFHEVSEHLKMIQHDLAGYVKAGSVPTSTEATNKSGKHKVVVKFEE